VHTQYDLVVVGAGPGGSTAARFATAAGLKVAFLEKKRRPGLKLCAGGVPGRIRKEFGVPEEAVESEVRNYFLYTEQTGWHPVRSPGASTTYRTTNENEEFKRLDYQLAMLAVEAGAELLTNTECVNVLRDEEGCTVAVRTPSGEKTLTSRLVIGADGFHSTVSKAAGLFKPYTHDRMAVAAQHEVLTDKKNDDENCYHVFDPGIAGVGYLWFYPKSHGWTVGLGCLASQIVEPMSFVLERILKTNKIYRQLIPPGSRVLRLEGASIPMAPLGKIFTDNVMLVGDAAGHCDSMTGDGIYHAMAAGKLAGTVAAEAISKGDYSEQELSSYQSKWSLTGGRELAWSRERLEIVSRDFLSFNQRRIRLLRNRYTGRLVHKTNSLLPRYRRFVPHLVWQELIASGVITDPARPR
jgi:digeranylgeranylglycerophospholipid reductase